MSTMKDIEIGGDGKLVGRDDNSVNLNSTTINHSPSKTKLSILFDRLKEQFEQEEQTEEVSDELNYYITEKDVIGLEQKLIDGNLSYLYEDASELKDAYTRKLYKYQLYDSAQEIHVFILGIICEKFRNLVYPLIIKGIDQAIISETISIKIVDPIMKIILEQGCNDIMGLSSKDIDGMIYFLTGRCHIKWNL